MGIYNSFSDVSNESIPILIAVTAAGWVAYLRHLLHSLLQSCGLSHHQPSAVGGTDGISLASGLAGLIALADHINSHPVFSYSGAPRDCVVCLYELRDGEAARKLSCCHVFHRECLDGWLDQMNFSCPLCRSPLVAEERRADDQRRIGTELVARFS